MSHIRIILKDETFPYRALHSRKELQNALLEMDPSRIQVIYERASLFKKCLDDGDTLRASLKAYARQTKREETFEHSREQRMFKIRGTEYDGCYPDVVPEAEQWERFKTFSGHISDMYMEQCVCACCAGTFDRVQTAVFDLENIPNRTCLIPKVPHVQHSLTDGLLLYPDGIERGDDGNIQVTLCDCCLPSLNDNRLPKFSLANGMWLGDIPEELSMLTIPERLLISFYYPTAYIVKLYPKSPGAQFWKDWNFNSGLRGNVSTYKLDDVGIKEMMKGNIMPHPPEILASKFSITLFGPKGKPLKAMLTLCEVRRRRVLQALLWLKNNNPLYSAILIDESILARLPEGDIPEAISTNVKHVVSSADKNEADCFLNTTDFDDEEFVSDVLDLEENRPDVFIPEDAVCLNDPAVIAMDEGAVVDLDGFDIPDSVLLNEALSNAVEDRPTCREPNYAILRGNQFVNEYSRKNDLGMLVASSDEGPNHLLGCFPLLFPYGTGGFETEREVMVTYREHASWALRFADGRFAADTTFLALIFGVIQKRQVCIGSELQIRKQDYKRQELSINGITVQNLRQAVEEEKRGEPVSNRAVRALTSFVKATRRHVPGTDENRTSNRSKIYGMIAMFNPPNIWMTITCDDVNDPLVQIFCGVKISLDAFNAKEGPGPRERLENSTSNPCATTHFFFRLMNLILEDLLGIKVSSHGHITRERGILGVVKSYFGMVEAQGRGSLHLHMLLWLDGSPSSSETVELLKDASFRDRLEKFIQQNIHAHVPGLNADYIARETAQQKLVHKERASAYSRPILPSIPDFGDARRHLEFSLARTVQLHQCRRGACLIPDKFGRLKCKRRAPWELSPRAIVYESGLWYPEREYAYLNSWNPFVLFATRSNNDIKLLTNSTDSLHITFYITKYATKSQAKIYHASALLATRTTYVDQSSNDCDLRKKNRKLLSQCANTLNRAQEFSSQQMVSYIMGYGDRLTSHQFVYIYLSGALWVLENVFPEFHHRHKVLLNETPADSSNNETPVPNESGSENLQNAFSSYCLQMTVDGLQVKSQVSDYAWRGSSLESFSFLFFLLETYEPHNMNFDDATCRHERVPYLPDSPFHKDRIRILRHFSTEMLPDFMGSWLPRHDRDEEFDFYCASVLMLLKPWRQLADLKNGFTSWKQAFEHFMDSASPRETRIIDNFKFFYKSRDDAIRKARDEEHHSGIHDTTAQEESEDVIMPTIIGVHFLSNNTVQLDLEEIARQSELPGDAFHGIDAMNIAEDIGFFINNSDNWCFHPSTIQNSDLDLLTKNIQWQQCLEQLTKDGECPSVNPNFNLPSSVVDERQLNNLSVDSSKVMIDVPAKESWKEFMPRLLSSLTQDQRRACDIVFRHLSASLEGAQQEQLLMLICGSGGVGKSTVIRTMKQIFELMDARHLLAITATSGVAASNINGHTVHWWGGIPITMPVMTNAIEKSSIAMKKRRENNTKNTRYLILDEVSMLSQEILGFLSSVIAHHLPSSENDLPFGGKFSVILIGDFHQFPPVAKGNLALYRRSPGDSTWAHIGFDVFQHFRCVVLLTEQKRVVDVVWKNILERLRHGDCTADDLKEVHKLVLTNPGCTIPNFDTEPWVNAILVTPRNGVRKRWNTASVKKYARLNQKQLLVSVKNVTFADGTPLRKDKHSDILLSLALQDKTVSKTLPRMIYLTKGLRILLTFNVQVSADLANGTTGTIEDIFLDPREPPLPTDTSVHQLRYPPRLILFRPDRTDFPSLPGLPQGVLPIQPSVQKFKLTLQDGSTVSLIRTQYPITEGYSFTDYKAQGQTIAPVIVDLRKPPSGGLTQFSLYVALSRGISREYTRILDKPNSTLFTTPPDDDLQEFDKKLGKLNNETKKRFA